MTGGALELVARGHEDIYLTNNPVITFFKSVYRRHTIFTRDYLELNFSSDINLKFGGESVCPINKYGDLLYRLFLIIKLPKIISNNNIAWIKKIGHYIINNIYISLDNQIIDKLTGEYLEINYKLTKNKNSEPGYNKLIGHIPELYGLSQIKSEYELYIPLQFWFNKNIGNILPIISLNSEIKLGIQIKNLDELIINNNNILINNKLKLKLLAEYIYLNSEERQQIINSRLEYLINILEYSGDNYISPNQINNNIIELYTQFENPCRELILIFQPLTNILDKKYNKYNNNLEYIDKIKIKFAGRDRQNYLDSKFYNLINPLEYHKSDLPVGIYNYVFSLDPEIYQPSGSANLGILDKIGLALEIKLKSEYISDIKKNNIIFRTGIYSNSNKIFRVNSGSYQII